MTRKRKNVQESEEGQGPVQKTEQTSNLEGYGYVKNDEGYGGGGHDSHNQGHGDRGFPEKKQRNEGYGTKPWQNEGGERRGGYGGSDRGNRRGGRGGGRGGGFGGGNRSFGEKDFAKQYGAVGGEEISSGNDNDISYNDNEKFEDPNGRGEFPKDIVGYLRSIEQVKKTEGKIEDFILDKCADEVVGVETTLLEWTEAAVVVESVFGSSPHGAALFLGALSRLKHKKLADLFFQGASARTIENLIYVLCPVSKVEHVELISKFVDLLCDNWKDAVNDRSAAFLLRGILRVASGLGKKAVGKGAPGQYQSSDQDKPKFANNEMKAELKKIYEKIALLAFDPQLNSGNEESPISSLVFQDVVDADGLWKGRKADEYVSKWMEKDEDGEKLRAAWKGKNSSRIWERMMCSCREESRSVVWMGAISGKVEELANHPSANFALQKLIEGVTSLELATDVIDEITPLLVSLLTSKRELVVRSTLKCALKYESVQEPIIKQLRSHYRAAKASNKTHFMFNLLTNNAYDGVYFDVTKLTYQGSLLLSDLLQFSKVKTIAACFETLTADHIFDMARHKIGSHVLQSALSSPTLEESVKNSIVEALSKSWVDVISDCYGSHVFEAVWDSSDVAKKQDILKTLVPIHNTSKFWKFAMLRCDVKLFRQDRKAWVTKMKNWGKDKAGKK